MTMIKSGIYRSTQLSNEEYHGDTQSLSRSSLMEFKKSPRHYWAKYLNPDRPKVEPKPSWIFGTAFHTMILEYHLFDQTYFVMPKKVLLKDVGRTAYDEYKEAEKESEKTNKIVLSFEQYDTLCKMYESLAGNAHADSLIQGAIYESSYFWQDEHSGLMLKARPDILQGNVYLDLKTIDDASPNNYQREMAKYGYHLQGAMVRDGYENLTNNKLEAVINICVEKTYPYCVGIYIIDETALEAGHMEYKNILLDLKHAYASNKYDSYPIQTIGLPRWFN